MVGFTPFGVPRVGCFPDDVVELVEVYTFHWLLLGLAVVVPCRVG